MVAVRREKKKAKRSKVSASTPPLAPPRVHVVLSKTMERIAEISKGAPGIVSPLLTQVSKELQKVNNVCGASPSAATFVMRGALEVKKRARILYENMQIRAKAGKTLFVIH